MIYLYSGVPGSGKSYHTTLDIIDFCKSDNHFVITNLPVSFEKLAKRCHRSVEYVKEHCFVYDNSDITVALLKQFSVDHIPRGKENQCLLAFDEAADKFNARSFGDSDRMEWLQFFRSHRHFGYKVLLVSQHDRYLDRQIRGCIQIEVEHRSFKFYKFFGLILWLLFHIFQCIEYNYPMKGSSKKIARTSSYILHLNKRKADCYNTFQLYDDYVSKFVEGQSGDTVVFTTEGTHVATYKTQEE